MAALNVVERFRQQYDLRTYRRWTGGLYLSYLAAIIAAPKPTIHFFR